MRKDFIMNSVNVFNVVNGVKKNRKQVIGWFPAAHKSDWEPIPSEEDVAQLLDAVDPQQEEGVVYNTGNFYGIKTTDSFEVGASKYNTSVVFDRSESLETVISDLIASFDVKGVAHFLECVHWTWLSGRVTPQAIIQCAQEHAQSVISQVLNNHEEWASCTSGGIKAFCRTVDDHRVEVTLLFVEFSHCEPFNCN